MLKRLLNWGVSPSDLAEVRERTRACNALALLGAGMGVGFAGLDLWVGNWVDFANSVLAVLLFGGALGLNRARRLWAARVMAVSVGIGCVALGALATAPSDHGGLPFVGCAVLAPLVFSRQESGSFVLAALVPLVLLAWFEVGPLLGLSPPHLTSGGHPFLLVGNIFGTAVVSLLAVLHFERSRTSALSRYREAVEALSQQQALLAHSGRMGALGEMAASIAHEINNPLAALRLTTQRLQRLPWDASLGVAAQAKVHLDRLDATSERIRVIISRMLTFARREDAGACEPFSLEESVRDCLELLGGRFSSEGVTLKTELTPGLWARGHPLELSQVLVNLIHNALQALAGQPRREIVLRSRSMGDKVVLSVRDTGPGIPPELRDRVMEPFVTSRAPGKGTGLGLAISRHLVEAMQGRLVLTACEGPTEFEIELHAAERPFAALGR